eukprot:CAMPEP_0178459560 /NCGR_PEP_ID=MMETSP0689_2-20121128/48198_1 /TAXON_ID=160604 /ORGANISM="Amphidinium massartii, Strain CS-259" /LENGTH=105 /DNA_ID=CAMNT_0020086051 /DNA_START=151 /DNA_END=467 /DNA_ORIENTATION=+
MKSSTAALFLSVLEVLKPICVEACDIGPQKALQDARGFLRNFVSHHWVSLPTCEEARHGLPSLRHFLSKSSSICEPPTDGDNATESPRVGQASQQRHSAALAKAT